MSSLPRIARLYILSLIALAVGAVLFSAWNLNGDLDLWVPVLIVAVGIAVFDASPVLLFGEQIEITLSGSVKFAAVLLFSPAVAVLGTFAGTLLGELPAKRPWFKKSFNIAQLTVSIICVALVFRVLYSPQTDYFGSVNNVMAVIWAGLTEFLISTVLVSLIISLATQMPLPYVWKQNARQVGWYELSVAPLGAILAILWQYNPLSLILGGLPLLVVRHSYGVAIKLQHQTHDALRALVQVIDERDHHTLDHSERVSQYAQSIAEALGLSQEEIEVIAPAALLHDLGKVGMADDVLFSTGSLNPEERAHAQKHAEVGAMLLSKFPLFDRGTPLVRYHHERYDGKGYPEGLKGTNIPLGARIISVADAYQAMTEKRTYRRALSQEEAIAQLTQGSGTQFDPQVVEAFIRVLQADQQPSA